MKMNHLIASIVIALCVAIPFSRSLTKEIDPEWRHDFSPGGRLSDAGINLLDAAKIDVLNSNRRVDWNAMTRPVLAPLDGYPIIDMSFRERLTLYETDVDNWMAEFDRGARLALFAVEQGVVPPREPSLKEFRELWNNADPEKRIFISYTNADAANAMVAKRALEAQNYVVFTYLDADADNPRTTPKEVGKFFVEAGTRYVIASRNSRQSLGVIFEARYNEVIREYHDPLSPQITRETDHTFRPEGKYAALHPRRGPGGIVFGLKAKADKDLSQARLAYDQKREAIVLKLENGQPLRLTVDNPEVVGACFEFATSESAADTVLSIDAERNVFIEKELDVPAVRRNLISADKAPFECIHLLYSGPMRSRILDQSVCITHGKKPHELELDVELLVRIYGEKDHNSELLLELIMVIDNNAATISSRYGNKDGTMRFEHKSYVDFLNLARRLEDASEYAGWIAFFRWAKSNRVEGLRDLRADLNRDLDKSAKQASGNDQRNQPTTK